MHNTFEAYLVLVMIGILMVSDLSQSWRTLQFDPTVSQPGIFHYFNGRFSQFLHTGNGGVKISWLWIERDANLTILVMMFWVHICTQLIFLNIFYWQAFPCDYRAAQRFPEKSGLSP